MSKMASARATVEFPEDAGLTAVPAAVPSVLLPFGNDGWGVVNPGVDELPVATMITPAWSCAAALRAVCDTVNKTVQTIG
jgi:hypothetical protein